MLQPDPHTLTDQAQALIRAGNFSGARDLYEKICRLDQDSPEAWMTLGAIHGQLGDTEQAISCLHKAIALRPDLPEAHYNLGYILHGQGKLQESLPHFEQTVTVRPDYFEAWLMMGAIQGRLGAHDKAEACCRQAVTLRPDSPDAHMSLGNVLLHRERFDEAFKCYQQVSVLNPGYARAYTCLGHILRRLGKLQDAVVHFKHALEIDPGSVESYCNLGLTLKQLGRHDEAIACHLEAVRIKPDYAEAYVGLASIYRALGRYPEAVANYQQVLRLRPNDGGTRHMLASIGGAPTPAVAAPDYVSKLFDDYAERFDESLVDELGYRTPQHLSHAVLRAVGNQRKLLNIIDLGCGTGLCGEQFRSMARKLVGIDLSLKMIGKARERNIYDALAVSDLTLALQATDTSYDLILAADVLIYVGELAPVFRACATALKRGGLFAFSLEADEETESYTLRRSGRYAHSIGYIRRLAADSGFREISLDHVELRKEKGESISGYIFVLGLSGTAANNDGLDVDRI